MGLRISQAGLNHLKQWEGLRLQVYDDGAGYDTIGYGHLVLPGEDFSGGITQQQAEDLLRNDVRIAENAVNNTIRVPLKQNQFDALVSYAFNIGTGAFSRGNLAKLINAGAPERQIRDWWTTRYVTANGIFMRGLQRRRQSEADMYFSSPMVVPTSVAFILLAFVVVGVLIKIFAS